ncbi:MAG: enoyl-CoA hydratase/isomerase family protein [Candidatus Zixiibacteriota bacterium]
MVKAYTTVKLEKKGPVAYVSFCRPEIHNAFNDTLIFEMTDLFQSLKDDKDLRVIVLTGEGKSFCAGADLNWMRRVKDYSYEKNLEESLALADLFYLIYTMPLPVIGRINGAAIGGGTGFVSVCDIAVAAESAKFSFSEVKIGVVPACIGPYVIKKIGEGKAREFFISGERLTAAEAYRIGLVNRYYPDYELDEEIDNLIKTILSSGPNAIKMAKELISNAPLMKPDEFKPYTAEMIARLRKSDEGQEGMDAFLNKRKPNWVME